MSSYLRIFRDKAPLLMTPDEVAALATPETEMVQTDPNPHFNIFSVGLKAEPAAAEMEHYQAMLVCTLALKHDIFEMTTPSMMPLPMRNFFIAMLLPRVERFVMVIDNELRQKGLSEEKLNALSLDALDFAAKVISCPCIQRRKAELVQMLAVASAVPGHA